MYVYMYLSCVLCVCVHMCAHQQFGTLICMEQPYFIWSSNFLDSLVFSLNMILLFVKNSFFCFLVIHIFFSLSYDLDRFNKVEQNQRW